MAYNKKVPFLSDSLKTFIEKKFVQLLGVGEILVGLGVMVALLTYNESDPSLNVTSLEGGPSNLLGYIGSYLSDYLLQTFGYTSFLIPFLPIMFGYNLVVGTPVKFPRTRILFFFLGVLALSIGISNFAFPFQTWISIYPGGALGSLLEKVIISFTPLFMANWVMPICLGAGLLMLFYSLKLSIMPLVNLWVYLSRSLACLLKNSVQKKNRDGHQALKSSQDKTRISMEKLPAKMSSESKEKTAPIRKSSTKAAVGKTASSDGYTSPPLELLQDDLSKNQPYDLGKDVLKESAALLRSVLEDFGVYGDIASVKPGPVVTLYEFKPAPGTKTSRVVSLAEDIARSMSAVSARISVIPGYNALGIELPNAHRETVFLRSLFEGSVYQKSKEALPLVLGKDIGGEPIIANLAKMPHLLVAGTTGSGKSVSVNTMILSLLYRLSPKDCRFIMIDPKMLELSIYDGIPHLLTPVVTDPHKAVVALKWAVREMERRYQAMSRLGVRNIDGYNEKVREAEKKGEVLTRRVQTGFDPESGEPVFEEQELSMDPYPYIVLIVDEMADLMLVAGKDIESAVQRLAQMARAAGIHLIMATQRPSVDVITGTIKANFPTRVSFQVTSKIDSRTILGEQGAEQLLGQGDMLYMASGGRVTRVHGPFVSDQEVEKVVRFLKTLGTPDYVEAVLHDEGGGSVGGGGAFGEDSSGDALYDQALVLVRREQKASTSFIQRHLQIGYNRAAKIIEKMEDEGVVSPANHVGKREVLVAKDS